MVLVDAVSLEVLEELLELNALHLESIDVILALGYSFTRDDDPILDILSHFNFFLEETRLDLVLVVTADVPEPHLGIG